MRAGNKLYPSFLALFMSVIMCFNVWIYHSLLSIFLFTNTDLASKAKRSTIIRTVYYALQLG